MANSDLSPTLIKAMAFHNAIASWKDLISNAKRRIDSIRELEKATGTDQSAQIAILESEIAIYQTVIEHTEARRKELLGVSESQ